MIYKRKVGNRIIEVQSTPAQYAAMVGELQSLRDSCRRDLREIEDQIDLNPTVQQLEDFRLRPFVNINCPHHIDC